MSDPTRDDGPPKTVSMALVLSAVFAFAVMTVFAVAGALDGRNGSRPAFIVAAVLGSAMVLLGLVAIVKLLRQR